MNEKRDAAIAAFIEKYGEQYGVTAEDFEIPAATQADRTEAQALYTALLTDTLLEG